ncbi:MAG: helix-turn-helix transcriptional regulator [Butyrivibrio sp.]|jgi:transcriptional regulator with XRE-family HTH domain|uniref:helix-turn-helix domain-containing protein n=1 Tax=Butyrivibrio sp. TaxID=28121 RepID=UPI001EC4A194|nr:helix-turn-helix transcriptional regulator [Butyrivibrio sp.]MBE5841207.1 helix-turn-helix transcriptional regulator [Butyrivibrio sp.]
MQLKLAENIKRYRKEMGLTQDGLAEALGVTIGAVSKWENGNNVPDITTLMELANLYNISMDELLSYDKSSKNIDKMVETIENLCDEHKFDEAVLEANSALTRYPHTFKVLLACAKLYYYKSYADMNAKDCDTAIDLMNRCLEYFSQNTDPEVKEFTIRLYIAELYMKKDPDKALAELKNINYNGCNDAIIGQLLLDMNNREECLEYSSMALLRNFGVQYQLMTNMSLAVASSGKAKDLRMAVDLLDASIVILDTYAVPDSIGYTHKLKTISLIIKAWWFACLKEYDAMEECVRDSYNLAVTYDKTPHKSSELSTSIRFYLCKHKTSVYDSLGATAVSGIEALFSQKIDGSNKINHKHLGKVIECWNRVKKNEP